MRSTTTGRALARAGSAFVAVLGALALLTAGCGGDDTGASAGDAGSGGSGSERDLIIARDMDVNSLDPARAYCDTCQIYLTAVYETLVTVDPADISTQVARLAESWEANGDNTVFTFRLDPNATFADGSPVESNDVKWSWERLHNVKGSASYLMDGIESIETPDASTVRATFAAPNSAFLAIVSAPYMGIVNSDEAIAQAQSVADESAATADASEQFYFSTSLGSGAYELESYAEGESLVLARNEAYWNGTPAAPSVTIKQVRDSASQLQQLQAGDVDIAMQINVDALGQIDGDPDLIVRTVDSFNFVYIALSPGAAGAGAEEMQDPNVRRAMRLALDYDGILDATVAGRGNLQASPIPNGFEGSDGLAPPEQNLEEATSLMADAGLADGFTLDAAYPNVNVYGVDFSVMMQKVQQDLDRINISVNLQPIEFPQWVEQISGEGIPLTAVYFAPDHTDSSQYVSYFGMMEGTPWSARAGLSDTPLINPEEGPLFTEALASSGDARVALYEQLAQHLVDDLIIFPLVNPQLVLASQADVEGMHYSGCCNLDLALLSVG